MVTIKIPCHPAVKAYFKHHYPAGYKLSHARGFDKALYALLISNKSIAHYKADISTYSDSIVIHIPEHLAFKQGARHLTPFTIVALNQLVLDDIIKRDIARDCANVQYYKAQFRLVFGHSARSRNKRTFIKQVQAIRKAMGEHGLTDEDINVHTLLKIAQRTRKTGR